MIKRLICLWLLVSSLATGLAQAAVHHERYPSLSDRSPSATVLLIHGWSCDSTYWSAQLEALREHFEVITIDLAGHGQTPATRDDFSMASFGRDVAEVAAQLPVDQSIILVGHSMGGPVAVEAAVLLGERVRGVIGVDTFASIGIPKPTPDDWTPSIAIFAARLMPSCHSLSSEPTRIPFCATASPRTWRRPIPRWHLPRFRDSMIGTALNDYRCCSSRSPPSTPIKFQSMNRDYSATRRRFGSSRSPVRDTF
jgi:pimeloyl-ACP methyl ester carboxylesterase